MALRGDQQAIRAPSTAPDRAHPTTYMIAAQESDNVANAIGVVFVLSVYLSPIGILIWLVTLCMTVGNVTQDTNQVNDALRRGYRING